MRVIAKTGRVLGSVVGFVVVGAVWQLVVHAEQHRYAGAVSHGLQLWRIERWLHLPNEAVISVWTRGQHGLFTAAGWYYVIGHPAGVVLAIAVAAAAGAAAYWRAFATFALTALVCFLVQLWPTAPPRLMPVGAGATSPAAAGEYHSLGSLANQVASFPSVHVAWATCAAIVLWSTRLRWVGVLHAVATILVVVATANHTWLDSLAAALVALLCARLSRVKVGLTLNALVDRLPADTHPASDLPRRPPVPVALVDGEV